MSAHRPHARLLVWGLLAAAAALAILLAGVLRPARAAGASPLLPNLVADPPDNMELATDSSTGTRRLLLRFNGYIHNTGPGALDFRGSRAAPKVSKATEELVERAREKQEGLPPGVEEELAVPPMKVVQRLFTTAVGQEETNIERAHVDEPSAGEITYVAADGHHHWHLQRVAGYSLWNSSKTAEVAPAQKVGFCLDDSQHVEAKGPSSPVYADNTPPFRDFCQQYRPNATSLFEGVSPGWRDVYDKGLALQWVDASNVPPGVYWLREDINPLGFVKEVGVGEKARYANSPAVIPGFDALPQSVPAKGLPQTITLTSQAFPEGNKDPRRYAIVTPPQHGNVSMVGENQVRYTPAGSYRGPDSFTFSAADRNSEFPRSPVAATVSIVGPAPALSISGAQAEMVVGTSDQLTALVANDTGGVEWQASAGTLTVQGLEGQLGIYQAPAQPPPGGTVTVRAWLRDDPEVSAQQAIRIVTSRNEPATQVPGTGGNAGFRATGLPEVSRPRAMLFGHRLVMSTLPSAPGRVRLSAYLGHARLGSCSTVTPAGRSFTCRVWLGKRFSLRERISVLASLRVGPLIVQSRLAARRIPEMRMTPAGPGAHLASAGGYWCSPSTLVPVLLRPRP